MGANLTSPAMPGLGDLDAQAWSEIPLGMDAFAASGRGLVRVRGWWRIVIGSPAWSFMYGRPEVPGWQSSGQETRPPGDDVAPIAPAYESPATPSGPAPNPIVPLGGMDPVIDPEMGTATNTSFAVTPGGVEADAKGNLATSGASVDLTTSGTGDTTATVRPRARGWMDWLPWIFVLGAVGMVLGRKKE